MVDSLADLKSVASKTFFTDLSARMDEYETFLREIYLDSGCDYGERVKNYGIIKCEDYRD